MCVCLIYLGFYPAARQRIYVREALDAPAQRSLVLDDPADSYSTMINNYERILATTMWGRLIMLSYLICLINY